MKDSDFVFKFMETFFIEEREGKTPVCDVKDQKERFDICSTNCDEFSSQNMMCKKCGCFIPSKIQDPFTECPLKKWTASSKQWKEHYDYILEKMNGND